MLHGRAGLQSPVILMRCGIPSLALYLALYNHVSFYLSISLYVVIKNPFFNLAGQLSVPYWQCSALERGPQQTGLRLYQRTSSASPGSFLAVRQLQAVPLTWYVPWAVHCQTSRLHPPRLARLLPLPAMMATS